MKIKDYKCKCGHDDFFFIEKENSIGIYCSYCGKWFKWADKDERNLPMKQVQKIGKWLEKNRVYNEDSPIEEWQSCSCSVCGHYDTRPYMYYFDEPNYCSCCGSRMVGD